MHRSTVSDLSAMAKIGHAGKAWGPGTRHCARSTRLVARHRAGNEKGLAKESLPGSGFLISLGCCGEQCKRRMARWQTKVMVVVESMFRMDDDATTYCRIIWASVDRVVGIDDTSFSAGLGCHGCKCPRNRQTGHLERIEAETQGPSRPARARRGFGMTAWCGGSGVLVNHRLYGSLRLGTYSARNPFNL